MRTRARYLSQYVVDDLKEKMVFMGGPRQVGKTTLARHIGQHTYQHAYYLNWDARADRQHILAERFPADTPLVIFDELHKFSKWKRYLKGLFDTHRGAFHILVTGSARLDVYRKGGDSLMGRYHYYRLHPFSLAEALGCSPFHAMPNVLQTLTFPDATDAMRRLFHQLLTFGGFPEPFLKADERTLRRFHNERVDRLVREDIRDLESIRDLSAVQVLVELLPEKIGSKLSLNTLREDLQVAHKTVALWMEILERLYYHFRIYPFVSSKIRSLRKEPKLYLWDWSEVPHEAARLENMVGSHLLKFVHWLYDVHGYKAELYFVRDTEGREVDFLVTIARVPWFAVEVKLTDQTLSKPLLYFTERLKIPNAYQVIHTSGVDERAHGIRLISADKFLSGLV